jgi:hypothetical protein
MPVFAHHSLFAKIFVLIALLWQSMAMSYADLTTSDVRHAVLHWEAEVHHHHEDGTYHLDESKESAQHSAADHPSVSLAIASSFNPRLFGYEPTALETKYRLVVPSPALDRLFKPPRPRS